jgi:uncharacterized membrane protein
MSGWIVPTLLYILLLGALGVTTKVALRHISWQEVILWTAVVYAFIAIGMLLLGQVSFHLNAGTFPAIVSGILASTALIALYIALGRGDAGVVIPVGSAYPVVTLILAAIFLAEPITAVRAGGALLVIGGVVLISLGS